jgi:hypothetical protein
VLICHRLQHPHTGMHPGEARGVDSAACCSAIGCGGRRCNSILRFPLRLQVAYPIMQCGLFVAGAWGILLFKELKGKWQMLYWASGAVLLAGAALLSASK